MSEELTNQNPQYFHQFLDEDADTKQILDEIVLSASYDGEHHKDWLLDQVVRGLTGYNYEAFVKAYEEPIVYSDAEDDYSQTDWKTGIAP